MQINKWTKLNNSLKQNEQLHRYSNFRFFPIFPYKRIIVPFFMWCYCCYYKWSGSSYITFPKLSFSFCTYNFLANCHWMYMILEINFQLSNIWIWKFLLSSSLRCFVVEQNEAFYFLELTFYAVVWPYFVNCRDTFIAIWWHIPLCMHLNRFIFQPSKSYQLFGANNKHEVCVFVCICHILW